MVKASYNKISRDRPCPHRILTEENPLPFTNSSQGLGEYYIIQLFLKCCLLHFALAKCAKLQTKTKVLYLSLQIESEVVIQN